MDIINNVIVWTNTNSGFLGLLIFIITIIVGWISGVFRALIRKPKLKIEILKGPTFCASYDTHRQFNDVGTHRTAISLYLSVKNIGSAPTSIEGIHVGYKSKAYKNPFRWFWLKHLIISKSDFVTPLGEDFKVYPFLM
ncbi:hypothetical protein [Thiomicrorhabdus arctica]|uniref:hypothetical protein n=1 Tax=Thiomicrorhabdus arctica TaxID=131540 RepID=UPI00035C1719|nr:hypothetical protein [Thiomicrorhabdus arctica]